MFNNFGFNIASIFKKAEQERYELKHPYVGTEHLLLSLLNHDKNISIFCQKYGLNYENFKKELIIVVGSSDKKMDMNLYTPLLKRVINNALENAKEDNNGIVTSKHLLLSLFEEGEGIAIRLLISMNIDIDRMYDDLSKMNRENSQKKEIFSCGNNLNENINMDEKVVGRDKEINLIIETLLRKKKNNPILIGDAGVGKTAIVEELARRIIRKDVPDSLFDKKIISLEMGALISGTKYRGEFEEKLTNIIKSLEEDENIILFIDEIHSMVSAGGAEGAITAGDIFKPALARGKIKCIGATTREEYQKYFSHDKALMRRFEIVNVKEPNYAETKDILLKVKSEYELHHNVKISNDIIDKIMFYTDRFISNKKNPDKAIDFMDSVCSKVKNNNNYNLKTKKLYKKIEELKIEKEKCIKKENYDLALSIYKQELDIKNKIKKNQKSIRYIIKESDVIDVIENKTNLILSKRKTDFINKAEIEIAKNLYGVEDYTKEIFSAILNNITEKKMPLKILLQGSIGVGKSTLVELIAKNYPQAQFLKIDLKDYENYHDVYRLIGIPQGYSGFNEHFLLESLKNNQFTIILFDHYSFAHPRIKELINKILTDYSLVDNKGDKVSFNNTFIFITDDIQDNQLVGFKNQNNKNLNSELIDKVDKVINFSKLTREVLENYLLKQGVNNLDKVIEESNYEKYNYRKISKLLEKDKLLKV